MAAPSQEERPAVAPNALQSFEGMEPENMNRVAMRQITFQKWPGPLDADDMVRAGLYYTGEEDIVRCFSCLKKFSKWTVNMDPYRVHSYHSSNCPYMDALRNVESNYAGMVDGVHTTNSEAHLRAGAESRDLQVEGIESDDESIMQFDDIDGDADMITLTSGTPHAAAKRFLRKENASMRAATTCKRCATAQVDTLFLPCRHLVTCEACAEAISDCCVCGDTILGTVRTYMP